MNERVYELINEQINKELYSAYLYLSFADYYEDEGLDGYAHWFEIQAQEERDHALIFRNYLIENDQKAKLLPIDAPDMEFTDYIQPLEESLAHEKRVTAWINDIYSAAMDVKDYRAMKFLDWFIDEQMEEEDTANDMITKMKLFGSDARSLYELNQEYGARTYAIPAPLAAE